MDYFVASTTILGVWAALGPLVGVRYGQVLARRWQREQFIRQSKKEEYHEVLRALAVAISPIIQSELVREEAEIKAGILAENVCREVLESCIFVAKELGPLKVYKRWGELVQSFRTNKDDSAFAMGYKKLADQIREAALRSSET